MTDNVTHIVSIGGGTASTLELPQVVIEKYGKDNVVLVIAALKGEHPDLWRLVDECEKMTGLSVTRISYDPNVPRKYTVNAPPSDWLSIWDVFFQGPMMGNSRVDPCSNLLKRQTITRWMQDNYSPDSSVIHVGITFDEIDRTVAIMKRWREKGYRIECDLSKHRTVESSGYRAREIVGWEPTLYRQGFPHNNCGGFCVKAGKQSFARLLWFDPQLYFYHAYQESLFQEIVGKTVTIMSDERYVMKKVIVELDPLPDEGMFPEFSNVLEIVKTIKNEGVRQKVPLSLYEFAVRMKRRWDGLLPGESPFDYDDLDETPGCRFCDAMA